MFSTTANGVHAASSPVLSVALVGATKPSNRCTSAAAGWMYGQQNVGPSITKSCSYPHSKAGWHTAIKKFT